MFGTPASSRCVPATFSSSSEDTATSMAALKDTAQSSGSSLVFQSRILNVRVTLHATAYRTVHLARANHCQSHDHCLANRVHTRGGHRQTPVGRLQE